MRKPTTKQLVYFYVKNRGEVSGRELEKQADEWLTNAQTILRRTRELVQAGTLEQTLSPQGTARYKLKTVKAETMNKNEANAFLERLRQEVLSV